MACAACGHPCRSRGLEAVQCPHDELKSQWALERYGIPLDQCDHAQRQQLHTEVLDVAIAEL